MQGSVAQQIRRSAETLLAASQTTKLADAVNVTLNQFLKWPYHAGAAAITDVEGITTQVFENLVYTSSFTDSQNSTQLKAEAVACCIHSVDTLTSEELRVGYEKIATIKRLKRAPSPHTDFPHTDTPLGMIFAVYTTQPIEKLAEEMERLNKAYPSTVWPDMVVILTKGTINYAMQIEGDKMGGDFLLPNQPYFPVMPMYIYVFMRSLGLFSLNRMFALLFTQLNIFSPGAGLPEMKVVLEGVDPFGMNLNAYQFNLRSELVPVPEEMRRDRGVGLRYLPVRIEDHNGTLLSHIQFIPWQEGGVVRIIGQMPLAVFLVYLGSTAKDSQKIPLRDGEISSVLPITQADFREALMRLQRQSNMVVKPEQPSWTVAKLADEGTSSPFMARVFLGILRLKDTALADKEEKDQFDKAYEVVLMTLLNTRSTCDEIVRMLTEHQHKVSQGDGVRLQGRTIHVADPIDRKLRKEVEQFLGGAVRVLKQGMQDVAVALKLDIGCLFKQKGAFENGIVKLRTTSPELATYMIETRKWSENLVAARNEVEHAGWLLPKISYKETGGAVYATEPQISGEPVSNFVTYVTDRLCCFVEEVCAFGMQAQMPSGFSITEVPLPERKPECAERFQLALAQGGMPIWSLTYHNAKFEEV